MNRCGHGLGFGQVLLAVLLMATSALAAEQGVAGKKLLLKSGKIVLLAKDPSISIAGSDPVDGADSTISFDDGSGPQVLSLPTSYWTANGAATLFKYKNAAAPNGPSVIKVAKVKGGLLKLVGKGAALAVPNGPASINVVLRLDGGSNTYCMTFIGSGDGMKFLVKDATAASCAPAAPATPTATASHTATAASTATVTSTPTVTPIPTAIPTPPCPLRGALPGVLIGGACWYLGDDDTSCNTLCASFGRTCGPATITYVGSGGTVAHCKQVLDALTFDDRVVDTFTDPAGLGCFYSAGDIHPYYGYVSVATTCAAQGNFGARRACACQ